MLCPEVSLLVTWCSLSHWMSLLDLILLLSALGNLHCGAPKSIKYLVFNSGGRGFSARHIINVKSIYATVWEFIMIQWDLSQAWHGVILIKWLHLFKQKRLFITTCKALKWNNTALNQDAKWTWAFPSPFFYMENIIKSFLLEEGCAGCGEGDSRRLMSVTCQCVPEDIPWLCGRKIGSISQACWCLSSSLCSRLYSHIDDSGQESVSDSRVSAGADLHLHLHCIIAGGDAALSSHSYSHWEKRSLTTHFVCIAPKSLHRVYF